LDFDHRRRMIFESDTDIRNGPSGNTKMHSARPWAHIKDELPR
jgi:hypothetical protein